MRRSPGRRGDCIRRIGRLLPHATDLARAGDVADEAQSRGGLAALATWLATLVKQPEMPDHRLQRGPVTRRRDHRVRLDAGAVREFDAAAVEPLDGGDHLDAAVLDRLDRLLVDDRRGHAEACEPARHALLGDWEAVGREVADGEALGRAHDHVRLRSFRASGPATHDRSDRRPQEDVGRRSDRQPDAAGATRGELVRDLHGRSSRIRQRARPRRGTPRDCGIGGVQEAAGERLAAGPGGDYGRVFVTGRDDHVTGGDVAGRGAPEPSVAVAVDPLDARLKAHVERARGRVVLQVARRPRRAAGTRRCRAAYLAPGSCDVHRLEFSRSRS